MSFLFLEEIEDGETNKNKKEKRKVEEMEPTQEEGKLVVEALQKRKAILLLD